MCKGNQCCPATPESNGQTFPCPTAAANFAGCQATHASLISQNTSRISTCPGSGDTCVGNQCCPGFEGSEGKTFPCPAADPDFTGCQLTAGKCTGTETACIGNQCCPGTAESNWKTFPCPHADPTVALCDAPHEYPLETEVPTTTEAPSTAAPSTAAPTQAPSEVSVCPGSNVECTGNQCCPGYDATGGLTFPCPGAEATFDGCQINEVDCPGSSAMGVTLCRGNQCCPGTAESNDQTFRCPTADPNFDGCQSA